MQTLHDYRLILSSSERLCTLTSLSVQKSVVSRNLQLSDRRLWLKGLILVETNQC